MATIETDYLIIGAGAVGLCFADTMLAENPDVHLTIVDKHPKPGGHWNDAYGFVTLHQPSDTYGISSLELGTGRIDDSGFNKGYMELASGSEVLAHFDNAMRDLLLPTGRVSYHPMSEYIGNHRFRNLLSGEETEVKVRRKLVDATYFQTSTPATHKRKFEVADDVRVVSPGELMTLWKRPEEVPQNWCILGGGKTAMDTGVWLLTNGVPAERISWVRPRETWLINRHITQPSAAFFEDVIAGQTRTFEASADAETAQDIFLKLEETGDMLRLDKDVLPTMFHYPTISEKEVEILRAIEHVIRKGRVEAIDGEGMTLVEGREPMPEDTLYIDCTASAVRPRPTVPIFQDGLITPQLLHVPLVGLNASVTALTEIHYETDEEKNALGEPVAFIDKIEGYPVILAGTAMNRVRWTQSPAIMKWLESSRLNPGTRAVAEIQKTDPSRLAAVGGMQAAVMKAMPNLQRLVGEAMENETESQAA